MARAWRVQVQERLVRRQDCLVGGEGGQGTREAALAALSAGWDDSRAPAGNARFSTLRTLACWFGLTCTLLVELLMSIFIPLLTFVIPVSIVFSVAVIWARFADTDPRTVFLVGLAVTWLACLPAFVEWRRSDSIGGYGRVAWICVVVAAVVFVVCLGAGWTPMLG
jgi:hypothetical protein